MLRNSTLKLKVIFQRRTPQICVFSAKSDSDVARKLKKLAERTLSDDEREEQRNEKASKGAEKLGNYTSFWGGSSRCSI